MLIFRVEFWFAKVTLQLKNERDSLHCVALKLVKCVGERQVYAYLPDPDPNDRRFVAMAVVCQGHRADFVVPPLHLIRINGEPNGHEFP